MTIAYPPFLSDDEIRQIASPLVQPAAIVRWFKANGFDALKVRPNGMPLIARNYFDSVTTTAALKTATSTGEQPDIAGYLAGLSRRAKSRPSTAKV